MGKMDNRNTTIKKNKIWSISIVFLLSVIGVNALANEVNKTTKRVPAEWETQEAIWIQWPGYWEKEYEPTFAKISAIISRYEKLHILYNSEKIYEEARKAINNIGDRLSKY
jgi:agmatine/peptidylarginine deiminase